jgi:protein phosphatase
VSPIGVIDSAGQSQTGHVRSHNEDSYLMRGPLFLVADGMGGAAAGEIASTMCTEAFAEINLIRLRGADALRSAVSSANTRIYDEAQAKPELAGMGTTMIAALIGDGDGGVTFAHVGDSRAYLLREGVLRRLSEDHSVVAELVASGHLTEEEAVSHPQRSVITRVLGAEPSVQVDTFSIDGMEGDVVLLCSDGLTGMVTDERIAELLAADAPAETIVRTLVRAALDGGGEDNITAIVFRLGEVDEQPTGTIRMVLTSDPDLLSDDDDDGDGWRPGRRTLFAALGTIVVVLLLAVGAVVGLRESHFIGANESTGRVEIYQGVPWDLFFGIKLYHPVHSTSITYASLDPQTRKELFDHRLRSESDAEDEIKRIEEGAP